jgi:hypothetical protein
VYAGLIPALRRRADGRSWAVVTLRPGDAPLHALVRAFYTAPAELTPFEADQKVKSQVDILRSDPEALADRVRGVLAANEERGTDRLLLYIDQWEELYTLATLRRGMEPAQAAAEAAQFIDLLLHAAQASPCAVVLTVRADSTATCCATRRSPRRSRRGWSISARWVAPTSPARLRNLRKP